jgi:hypothetical protein
MPTDNPAPRAPSDVEQRVRAIAHEHSRCWEVFVVNDRQHNGHCDDACEQILALCDDAARAAGEATKAAMVRHVGESADKLRDWMEKFPINGTEAERARRRDLSHRAGERYRVEEELAAFPVPAVPPRPEAQKGEVGR